MRLFQVVWDYIAGSILTTKGDIVKRGAAVNARLPVGTSKKVLGVNAAGDDLEYRTGIDVATTKGDIIKRGAAACARLAVGAAKKALRVNAAGDDLEYSDLDRIIEKGASAVLNVKVINISDWDMNATAAVNVAHGLTMANIRHVNILIRNDADNAHRDLEHQGDGYYSIDTTNVTLTRKSAGFFQSVDYDSTSFNRGWVIIWSIE